MSNLVFELLDKPPLRKTKDGRMAYPNSRYQIELIDDVVIDDEKRTIAVVSGETDIYLDKMAEKDRKKLRAETLYHKGIRLYIDGTDPRVVKFVNQSHMFNDKGDNRQIYKRVNAEKDAIDMANIQRKMAIYTSKVYDEKNWEKVKAMIVSRSKGNIDLENISEDRKTLERVRLVNTISRDTIDDFAKDFGSQLTNRIYEMNNVIKAGKVIVDKRAGQIRYKSNNHPITGIVSDNPAVDLAEFTMKPAGAQAYNYLTDGMKITPIVSNEDPPSDINGLELPELINRAIRLDVFNKDKKGSYRYQNTVVGGSPEAVVDHFTKYPDKVETLRVSVKVVQDKK